MTEIDVAAQGKASRRWLLPVIIAGVAVVTTIVLVLILRLVLANPAPPLGATPTTELRPGSCIAEAAVDLTTYTVVECTAPHPQQLVAEVKLAKSAVEVYTSYSAITSYVEHICDRFIEYGLYVQEDVTQEDYDLVALAIPERNQWEAGADSAWCAIVAVDGTDLTESLYRPMP